MGKGMIDSESKSQQRHVYGHYKNWQDNSKTHMGTQRTKKNQGSLKEEESWSTRDTLWEIKTRFQAAVTSGWSVSTQTDEEAKAGDRGPETQANKISWFTAMVSTTAVGKEWLF